MYQLEFHLISQSIIHIFKSLIDLFASQAIIGVEGQKRINVKVISFAVEFNKNCAFDFLSLNGRK